ncbi:ABC transporter substrate-binding protein, partial [Bacillus sp. S34]|nr:ABC transporter substrate-binding protein [Bacillus sp. S34]
IVYPSRTVSPATPVALVARRSVFASEIAGAPEAGVTVAAPVARTVPPACPVPLTGKPKDIGTRGEPSTDTIASIAPDLIVATDDLKDSVVKQLRKIAPTIVVTSANASDQLGAAFLNPPARSVPVSVRCAVTSCDTTRRRHS